CKGPGGLHALLLVRNRGGLDRTDPDRQVPVAVDLLEQHDRLVTGQLDPHPNHVQLPHRSAFRVADLSLHGTRSGPESVLRRTPTKRLTDRVSGPIRCGPTPRAAAVLAR